MVASAPAVLYATRVFHRRHRPQPHEFAYNLWALKIDLSRLDLLQAQNLLGGTSPLSLRLSDFGPRDGSPLLPWFQAQLAAQGYATHGPHEFVFLPRFHGRGFCPIAVYVSPQALLFEVHNTAGEAHAYLLPRDDLEHFQAWKRLWVSPFSAMHGRYTFGFQSDAQRLNLRVQLHDPEGPALLATLSGPGQPLTHAALKALEANPGITGAAAFRQILWQALRLRLKGLRPRWGAFAPKAPVTRGQQIPLATHAQNKAEAGA